MIVDWTPYLSVDGIELCNQARTLSYLRNGLAESTSGHFRVRNPQLIYPELYTLAGVSAFIDPVTDGAPWYDPELAERGSDKFLGLLLSKPNSFGSVTTRETIARGGDIGGASFGAEVNGARVFTFTGTLCAVDDEGKDFGMRWLANIIGGCDPCSLSEMTIFSFHSDLSFTKGQWVFYDVAQTAGITETSDYPYPQITDVTFELTAGNPLLYTPTEIVNDASILDPDGTLGGACIDASEWLCGDAGDAHTAVLVSSTIGKRAPVISFDSPGGVHGIDISATKNDGSSRTVKVSQMEPGSQLVVDAARQRIVYTDPNGVVVDGLPLMVLEPGMTFPWDDLTVDTCDDQTVVSVKASHPSSYGAQTTVQIAEALRSK